MKQTLVFILFLPLILLSCQKGPTDICSTDDVNGCFKKAGLLFKENKTQEAKDIFTTLCKEKKLALACRNLGSMVYEVNRSEAIAYYQEACDLKDYLSCNNIGFLAFEDKDIVKALKYYELACENKNGVACQHLYNYWDGKKDKAKAKKYQELACSNGIGKECFDIAEKAAKEKNKAKAGAAYYGACQAGIQEACPKAKDFEKQILNTK